MKMRRFFPIVAATALLFAGCAKENFVEPQVGGKTVLTAGIQTKTLMQNDAEVLWTNGDVINVNGVNSAALALTEPSATAEFTFDAVLEHPYKAVFPASIYKDGSTVTLPAYQTYAEGTFAQNAAPMAAYLEEGSNLGFKNLANVVKLTVKAGADTDKIAFVEFKGNAGEQVAGDFAIDFATMALTPASTAAADKTVKLTVAKELTAEGVVMYIVVPAQNYSAGFTVKVVDLQGHYMEKSKASAVELAAGQVYELPAFEFAPTATQLDAEITSAAELNAFIAKYNAGEYPAEAFVKIANEFEFTAEDNAAFESIKSFGGVFDGNGMNIYNFNAGKPLAETVLENAIVKNLTVEGAATVQAVEGSLNMGTFAGALQGSLEHCVSKVDYTVTGAQSAGYIAMGALVGRLNAGKISDCSAQGSIVFDDKFSIAGEETAYIGGLVGRNSNAAGIIENCQAGVAVKFAGTATYNVLMGGVVGHTNGTVEACQVFAAGDGSKAAIVVDSDAAKYVYAGGVVGLASETSKILNCQNAADLEANLIRNAADECRRVRLAGIAGEVDGVMTGCTNDADVTLNSSVKTQWLAGLAGSTGKQAEISQCSNNGAVLLAAADDADKGGRENYVGGLMGQCSTSSVSDLTNAGAVRIDMIDYDNTSAYLYVGGCFGIVDAAIEGAGDIVNNAAVTWNSTEGWVPKGNGQFAIGGVVGITKSDVHGLCNNGEVKVTESVEKTGAYLSLGGVIGLTSTAETMSISECVNTGEVNFAVSGAARSYSGIYIGGVLGQNPSSVALTMSNCQNSAYIHGGLPTTNNSSSKYIGGIIGYLLGSSTLTNCQMTGRVYSDDWNNESSDVSKGAATGGLVGRTLGLETSWILIKDCTVNMSASNPLKARRGWIGGATGYAKWAHIENCDFAFDGQGSYYVYGGIAGQMVAATAKNCTVTANTTSSQTKYAGGLVGRLNGLSWIDGCTFRGDVASTKSGAVLGILAGQGSAAGAQIKNCKYKATVAGAASTVLVGANPENVTLTDNTELAE